MPVHVFKKNKDSYWVPKSEGLHYAAGNVLIDNGKVGIGTATPVTPLEVAGSLKSGRLETELVEIRRAAGRCNAGVLNIWDTTNNRGWHITNRIGCATEGSVNDLKFFFYDGTVHHHRIAFKSNGRVGIGYHKPQYRLDVNGAIRGTNFVSSSDQCLKQNIQPLDKP